eukprot:5986023-Ditylum_brightwellii.AAC.1
MLEDIKSTMTQSLKGVKSVHVQTSVTSKEDTYSRLTMTTRVDSEARSMESEQGENKNKEKKMSDEDGEEADADKELLTQPEEDIMSTSSYKSKIKDNTGYTKKNLTMVLRTRKQKLLEQCRSPCSSEELGPGGNDISQE